MYKLLVTDVDGTLLDSNSRLTQLNKKALKDCIDIGINVMLATGKSINSTMYIIEELGLKLPQITMGGALVITPERKVIDAYKIPSKLYLDFVENVRGRGCELAVATIDSKIYYQEYTQYMDNITAIGEKINKTADLRSDYFRDNVVSITIPITQSNPMDSFIRKTYGKKLKIARSGKYFFDILSLDSSKGIALTGLIKDFGVKKEEVVSFGDSQNDISLFEASGLKIAVGNSYPELLEIADIVTEENYNSGLGKAIYRYILKKDPPINHEKI